MKSLTQLNPISSHVNHVFNFNVTEIRSFGTASNRFSAVKTWFLSHLNRLRITCCCGRGRSSGRRACNKKKATWLLKSRHDSLTAYCDVKHRSGSFDHLDRSLLITWFPTSLIFIINIFNKMDQIRIFDDLIRVSVSPDPRCVSRTTTSQTVCACMF